MYNIRLTYFQQEGGSGTGSEEKKSDLDEKIKEETARLEREKKELALKEAEEKRRLEYEKSLDKTYTNQEIKGTRIDPEKTNGTTKKDS